MTIFLVIYLRYPPRRQNNTKEIAGMKIDLQVDEHESGRKVIIDSHPVPFANAVEAEAYVARLQERLQAAQHAFVTPVEASA